MRLLGHALHRGVVRVGHWLRVEINIPRLTDHRVWTFLTCSWIDAFLKETSVLTAISFDLEHVVCVNLSLVALILLPHASLSSSSKSLCCRVYTERCSVLTLDSRVRSPTRSYWPSSLLCLRFHNVPVVHPQHVVTRIDRCEHVLSSCVDGELLSVGGQDVWVLHCRVYLIIVAAHGHGSFARRSAVR